MDAPQRATIRIDIFIALSETTIQATLSKDKNLPADRFKNDFCMFDQWSASEVQKSFIRAHAGTSAASQHESGHV
jgi:hypothetical protein